MGVEFMPAQAYSAHIWRHTRGGWKVRRLTMMELW